jgi:hypothetical protein
MRWKIFALMMCGFFLIGNVFALTTIIEVKTLPHHTVFLTPISPSTGEGLGIQPLQGFSGQYGDIKFELDCDESFFDLQILVKDGQLSILNKKILENFVAGSLIQVEALPEGVEPLVKPGEVTEVKEITSEVLNETNESIEFVEEEGIKEVLLNGYSLIEENKPMVNSIYYSVLGFTALLLIFLTVRKNGNKVEKIEKKKGNVEEINEKDEDDLALEEAKAKVKELENKKNDKIAAVKRKLIEDQKELLRLRGIREQEKKSEISSEEMKKRLQAKINEDKY